MINKVVLLAYSSLGMPGIWVTGNNCRLGSDLAFNYSSG
jgi:hypothetical protein